jgi:hypothetical protein
MQILRKILCFSQEKALFPKRLVFDAEIEGGKIEGEEAQSPPAEVVEGQEVVNEAESDLKSLNEEVVVDSTNKELESLKEQVQKLEEVKPPETGISQIDAYIKNLNKEGKIDELKEKVTPKTGFVGVVLLLLQMYLKKKNQPDMTGKKETWADIVKPEEEGGGLAADMFKKTPDMGTPRKQLLEMLVEHKCNTSHELEMAISDNRGLEFDVVWDTPTNQFVIQHNFVSSDQGRLFTCKEAYKIMNDKGSSWDNKLILDLKGRMGMRMEVGSSGFKEQSYRKIQSLLTGMPDDFKSNLYLSTFDPYTEAMIWAYKGVAEQRGDKNAENIKVMGDSMSIMSYGVSQGEAQKALDAIQGETSGIISAFQTFFDKGTTDKANHSLHALSDRDGNGRADTKVHMSYEQCAANGDYEANNIIATKDPIRVRAEQVGGLEAMRKLVDSDLVLSINDDLEYLKHIVSNLDSEGRYYGVKPEDIVVYGVEDENELYEVLLIAHQRGHKWNAVVHDVPIPPERSKENPKI